MAERRLVDLSFPISEDTPRWKVRFESVYNTIAHKSSTITLPVHSLTHLDAPLHYVPGGASIDAFPLDLAITEAAVLDLTHVEKNRCINVEDVAPLWPANCPPTVLLRTDWPKRAWRTPDFWAESPYICEDTAAWIADQGIKIIGYDFPQEYPIRQIASGEARLEDFAVHHVFLQRGVWQIEYLNNLHLLPAARVRLYLFPLALVGIEGSPVRVAAQRL